MTANVYNQTHIDAVLKMRAEGKIYDVIAHEIGVSRTTIRNIVLRHGDNAPRVSRTSRAKEMLLAGKSRREIGEELNLTKKSIRDMVRHLGMAPNRVDYVAKVRSNEAPKEHKPKTPYRKWTDGSTDDDVKANRAAAAYWSRLDHSPLTSSSMASFQTW